MRRKEWFPWLARVLGPLAGLVVFVLIPDSYRDATGVVHVLELPGRLSGGLATWMGLWWLTEAVPLWATALLPLILLPPAGAASVTAASGAYVHPLILLFFGGFIIALAMEKWRLHRRFALATLGVVGARPRRIVGGFMAVTALLSMWVSNTATAMMMLPIATSVLALAKGDGRSRNLEPSLLLGIAYGASIGGIGTLIGTPPNVFLASYANEHLGTTLTFASWLVLGLPLVALFLPLAWLLLTRVLHPLPSRPLAGVASLLAREQNRLGPMTRGERATLAVFLLTATAWICRPLLPIPITDTHIALAAAGILFVLPVSRTPFRCVMDIGTARRVPWGILVLFGGGLCLAGALDRTGLAAYLGTLMSGLGGLPTVAAIAVVTALVIFLTELTSNTATAATLIPILAGIAPGLGLAPMTLAVPATMAASCAFMMPVATPPNAIVFGSGRITIRQMVLAGFWLNLAGIAIITLLASLTG